MIDTRIQQLAKNIIHYSIEAKKGDKILIEAFDMDHMLVNELIKEAFRVGAYPYTKLYNMKVQRQMLMGGNKEYFDNLRKYDLVCMEDMDCYIGIRGAKNSYEQSDVPSENMGLYSKYYSHDVHHNTRVAKTRWVIMRYPNESMSQLAGMSTEKYEEFYFSVCNLDYSKMDQAMNGLKALMDRTDKVRLVAPGTDLTFSIKGIGAIKCSGKLNIPDGEVYSAPVKNSVNGTITYNTPSIHDGIKFENISLTFQDGKIVKESGNYPDKLKKIFDTDEGARYVGEFAIGVNPYINHAIGDILFDEKIAGSIHFTPGSCYDDAFNGNNSALHWDLVLVMTPAFGGGEIYFDDVLIRKDGLFVLPELLCLNPENLK